MKVFISGAISSDPHYIQKFRDAAMILVKQGYTVMNPAVLPHGFEQDEYLHICEGMIDVCDGVVFLPDWKQSQGSTWERKYSIFKCKKIGEFSVPKIRFYNVVSETEQKLYC